MKRRTKRVILGVAVVVITYTVSYLLLCEGDLIVHSLEPGIPEEGQPARHNVSFKSEGPLASAAGFLFAPATRIETTIRNRVDRQARLDEALGYTVQYERPSDIQRFIAEGANPNASWQKGTTLLHIAAQIGLVRSAKALIAGGADVKRTDDEGRTALHRAAELPAADSEEAMIKLLIDAGVDPLAKDNRGRTAMDIGADTLNGQFCQALEPYLAASEK